MNKNDILSSLEEYGKTGQIIPKTLAVLPLRDIVIYPFMIFPVLIGRNSSLKAVNHALENEKFIFLTAQKNPNVEEPGIKDLYTYGTTAKIIQVLRLPNNLLKVLVEGLYQSKIKKAKTQDAFIVANVEPIIPVLYEKESELQATIRRTSELFSRYVKSNHNLTNDIYTAYENLEDPLRKLFFAAANILQKVSVKQVILEEKNLQKQYFKLASIIATELDLLKMEDEIESKVQNSIQKTQKKFYVMEQIKALQKELGDEEESMPELIQIKEALDKIEFPSHVREKAIEEFERLKKTPAMSPEFSVNRNYLELLTSLPWTIRTSDNLDIAHVRKILDEDHYNLEKPKERILEFIAVLNLAGQLKRQILCFIGPPGVGKTSLGKSIARALGRKFVRFSLGGVRDEAEIRGHRRTYIGAMPGKIIQAMKKAGSVNPVILLDEIDKMTTDFRGDPSAALLEVLDPEQNVAFNDHYLEVDYDLSNVLFITTANVRYEIPLPLQDRMEIIDLNSYLEPEKLQIAKKHILPKLLEEYGLKDFQPKFADDSILKLIREYTRESGVRNLEREIASVLRKYIKDIVFEFYQSKTKKNDENSDEVSALKNNKQFADFLKNKKLSINAAKIEEYLKAPRFKVKKEDLEDKVGVATGLAWTSVGGDILPVEVSIMPGAERLTLTGKLGDVMKESAKASLTYIRSNAAALGVPEDFYKRKEIHVHVPEGAIPKDGPSAGITLTIAMISAASGMKVRGDFAMTGEITLRGNILPIGGLSEKLLAAKRMDIKNVIIPADNERDVEDINPLVKENLRIIGVKHISEAIPYLLIKDEESKKNIKLKE